MALGRTFIGDDRKIVELQREGLKFNPNLMLIQDTDHARHLVPPGQEGLGGIGRKRHAVRQSCAGTGAALEKLTSPCELGVAAPARPV